VLSVKVIGRCRPRCVHDDRPTFATHCLARYGLMSAVVRVPLQDCTGAVELFGENEAGEFVGHGDWAKRQAEVGLGKSWFGPSVGWPDGENEMLGALVAAVSEPVGQIGGGQLFPPGIKQDGQGGNAGVLLAKPGEEGGFRYEGFGLDGTVGGDAFYVKAGKRVVA